MLEKTLESPLDCKEIQPVHSEDQSWIFTGRTDAEAPILWPPDAKSWLIGKDPDAGKDWRQKEKEAAELNRITNSMDMNLSKLQEMVKDREAWLVAVSGVKKKSDMTEWLNQNGLLYGPTLTTVHDYWKTIALTIWTLSAKWCLCFSVHCLGLLQLFFQRASIF